MITRPDEYKHTNDNYAIVDNDNVRGGVFNIASLTTVNLLLIPADKRKLKTSVNDSLGLKSYSYSGSDLTDANWGLLSLWKELNEHVSGFSNKPASPLTEASIISQIAINTNGHVTGVTTRKITPEDIGAAGEIHSHGEADSIRSGFLSSEDKIKLDSVEDSADANQNAFSNIIVDSTTISSTVEEDTFTINSGTGIEITPSGKTITISSTGGYTHPTGFTDAPTTALSGANVVSKVNVNTNGHVTGVTSRQLTPGDIGASASTHTHNGLLPSGGTVGQILVKNSSTDYDASFKSPTYASVKGNSQVFVNISLGSPISNIYSALPSSYNLEGKIYTLYFAANVTYVFTEVIDLSKYYNGTIVFSSNSPTNSIFSFPESNIYPSLTAGLGFIRTPSYDCEFIFTKITVNLTYKGNGSYSLFTSDNNFYTSLIIRVCSFYIIGGENTSFSLINPMYIPNLVFLNNTIRFESCLSSYMLYSYGSMLFNNPARPKGILTWYFINITAFSNLTDFTSNPSGISFWNMPFIHAYYKNISTLVPNPSTITLGNTSTWVLLP